MKKAGRSLLSEVPAKPEERSCIAEGQSKSCFTLTATKVAPGFGCAFWEQIDGGMHSPHADFHLRVGEVVACIANAILRSSTRGSTLLVFLSFHFDTSMLFAS